MDYFIDDTLGWAIELLREGQDMTEHARRFEANGTYSPLLPSTNAWCLIDFRTEKREVRANLPNMWHVLYADDFSEVIIMQPNHEKLRIRLLGDEARYYIQCI